MAAATEVRRFPRSHVHLWTPTGPHLVSSHLKVPAVFPFLHLPLPLAICVFCPSKPDDRPRGAHGADCALLGECTARLLSCGACLLTPSAVLAGCSPVGRHRACIRLPVLPSLPRTRFSRPSKVHIFIKHSDVHASGLCMSTRIITTVRTEYRTCRCPDVAMM